MSILLYSYTTIFLYYYIAILLYNYITILLYYYITNYILEFRVSSSGIGGFVSPTTLYLPEVALYSEHGRVLGFRVSGLCPKPQPKAGLIGWDSCCM